MRYLLLVFVLFNCADKNNTGSRKVAQQDVRPSKTKAETPEKNNLLGVWTDGSGPNASFRIDDDSIYDVEHFTMTRYTYKDGEIKFHYDDEAHSSKVSLLHPDTIVFEDQYGATKYWRFTD
jgi:hypothetical protein